jgi:transcriptional regulator with XRE-family HTH domain
VDAVELVGDHAPDVFGGRIDDRLLADLHAKQRPGTLRPSQFPIREWNLDGRLGSLMRVATVRSVQSLSPFGALLRSWRRERGVSQLDLALAADTTTRHISFLETGRSRPSREMVVRLADALDIRLLEGAGLPALYRREDLHGPQLRPFEQAIERLLHAHEPYPGLVVDGHWNVVAANHAAMTMFGPDLVGANMIRRFYGDPAIRESIVNVTDVAWAGLARLRRQQRQTPLDEELRALVQLAEAAVADIPRPAEPPTELLICPDFRVGDEIVRTVSMVARFDTALELTLDELQIELTYPRDAAAERFFRTRAPG